MSYFHRPSHSKFTWSLYSNAGTGRIEPPFKVINPGRADCVHNSWIDGDLIGTCKYCGRTVDHRDYVIRRNIRNHIMRTIGRMKNE